MRAFLFCLQRDVLFHIIFMPYMSGACVKLSDETFFPPRLYHMSMPRLSSLTEQQFATLHIIIYDYAIFAHYYYIFFLFIFIFSRPPFHISFRAPAAMRHIVCRAARLLLLRAPEEHSPHIWEELLLFEMQLTYYICFCSASAQRASHIIYIKNIPYFHIYASLYKTPRYIYVSPPWAYTSCLYYIIYAIIIECPILYIHHEIFVLLSLLYLLHTYYATLLAAADISYIIILYARHICHMLPDAFSLLCRLSEWRRRHRHYSFVCCHFRVRELFRPPSPSLWAFHIIFTAIFMLIIRDYFVLFSTISEFSSSLYIFIRHFSTYIFLSKFLCLLYLFFFTIIFALYYMPERRRHYFSPFSFHYIFWWYYYT